MKPLFLMLAEANTGNLILIIALLAVAGIIGYLTAWFYAKSVYTPVIKGLETEKADLLKRVAGLEAEKTDLLKKVEGLKDDLAKLTLRSDKQLERIGKLENEITEKDIELNNLRKPLK